MAELCKRDGASVIKKVLNIASYVVICVLGIIIVCLLYFMFNNLKSRGTTNIFNHQVYIVRSNSMSPAFKTGSIVVVQLADKASIRENDIITYHGNDVSVVVTHRVVEVLKEDGLRFVTKGDANDVNDPVPVPAERVIGKVVFSVPLAGYVMAFIRSKQGLLLFIFIPGVLIVASQLRHLLKLKKKKSPDEDERNETLQVLVHETINGDTPEQEDESV
jgi:signal peptidase